MSALAIALTLLGAALALATGASGRTPARSRAESNVPEHPVIGKAPVGPLHRAGRWMVDGQGRVVVVHGFNLVEKNPPYVQSNFTDADARLLARNGYTVVRLGFIWAGVEPEPGVYDNAYIQRVLALDALLARHGIDALVDMHQDLWSATIAPGVGDGAPGWATLTSNLEDQYEDFWDNATGPGGIGIQTRFIAAWHHIAGMLRGHRNIIGIDPYNEPYPGAAYPACGPFTRCPAFESTVLPAFYNRVTGAIRAAGARQTIFPEGVADSFAAPALPKLATSQAAFNFHFYCTQSQLSKITVPLGAPSSIARICAPIEHHWIGTYVRYARRIHEPAFLSEFSCNDVEPDNAQVVDLVDSSFTSWTAWAYEPDDIGSDCPNQGFIDVAGKPSTVNRGKRAAFTVPYAAAIAGTPVSTSFDRATHAYRLRYRARPVPGARLQRKAVSEVFVPAVQYPHGDVVEVHGARIVSGHGPGWLALSATRGTTVTLKLTARRLN